MSKVVKEVSTVVGDYKNAQGEIKKRYLRIGSIIETKNGPMLKIDSIPLKEGGWDGWAYLNTPKGDDRPAQGPVPGRGSAPKPDFDDDIPF